MCIRDRNKEIEDLYFRYAQNNESLSVENEVMRRHLLELQQKNKEENLKLEEMCIRDSN